MVITTNHRTDGLYLPCDDRRHAVFWSELTKEHFGAGYWPKLWGWYESGGYGHVAAYLRALDLSAFDPKAPPPKTNAFFDIVDANRAPEEAELEDVVDRMGGPPAITLARLIDVAGDTEIGQWLRDRRNRRAIPHRLDRCDYTPFRNQDAKDGLWMIRGARQAVYAKRALSPREQAKAVKELVEASEPVEASDPPF